MPTHRRRGATAKANGGRFFQGRVAPFIFRFLPQRVRIWGLKKYYGL